MAADPFVTLDGIAVRVADQWVLQDLSWQIKSGENWVVWGANGAGKTTLARALLGDAPVVKGRIHRHYENNRSRDAAPDPVALVSADQHQDLYRRQQLLDAMAHFSGRLEAGAPASELLDSLPWEDHAYSAELARLLNLEAALRKPASVLSVGEMRKLLITGDNLQGYANELVLFGRPKGSGESVWQIRQQIGYVADDLQLRYQKKMSGLDVVCSGFFDSVGLYRHCTEMQRQTAQACMERSGIRELGPRLFSKMSFGQQRMVLIARAMVKAPRLLILDEPCNGLDSGNRQRVLEMLDGIGRRSAASLLYVSHRSDEMPACITHRLHLRNGRIHAIRPQN